MADSIPAPAAEVISPNEAKYWAEWAQKAPALMRKVANETEVRIDTVPYRALGVGLGAALGIATFTRHVPQRLKIPSGLAAAASFAAGIVAGRTQDEMQRLVRYSVNETRKSLTDYAGTLEKNPEAVRLLADFLSASVTGENIQRHGIENAVADKVVEFGRNQHYLDQDRVASQALAAFHEEKQARGR